MRRTVFLLGVLLAALAALPAAAGVRYTAVSSAEGQGAAKPTKVDAWVDGARAKIVFQQASAADLEAGEYLLTQDGGKTLYLVDPDEKTYAKWDLEAMFQALGSVMEAMGPMMNLSIDNVKVDKTGQSSGGTIQGLSTTHSTYKTTYDMTMKFFGRGHTNHVESIQDVWTTTALDDPAMAVWLRKAPITGFGELDKLVSAEMEKAHGFPLKTVTVSTTTNPKGKSQTTKTTMEVTSLDTSASIPASTFEIPAGYEETQMLPEGEPDQGNDEGKSKNPFKKIFGGG